MSTHEFEGAHGKKFRARLNPWPMTERGYCEPPTHEDPEIVIRSQLPLAELVEVVVHEGLHARFWDLDEESVEHAGEQISSMVLWALRERGIL